VQPNELKLITDAANYLENPSLLMQLANTVGKPLEAVLKAADKVVPGRLDDAVGAALRTALQTAVRTLPAGSTGTAATPSADVENIGSLPGFLHKMSVALTGSVGGLFGVAGLALELPITTTLMLRSIASIAQEFGERIDDAEVELQCLSVFSYGGPGKGDDALESSYLSARFAIQEMVTHAARAVAGLSAAEFAAMIQRGTAPALVSLIAKVAARFNVVVTQKMLVQSLPVLGAATGATLNVAFMDHFNRVARYHFGIRSLERKYGLEVAQAAYRDAVQRNRRSG
jgi:hypothetical protein